MIPLRRLLDVREEAGGRFVEDAVRIPLPELPTRVYELPRSDSVVLVAETGDEARDAVAWLRSQDRDPELTRDFEFTNKEPGGRLWQPNLFLEELAPQLPPGRALDLACGVGRDAVFLASLGWEVTAIDHLPDALERARNLERRYLGRADIEWIEADLGSADALVSQFDLVTVFFYMNRPLLAKVGELLSHGGSLVFETFTAEYRALKGKPRRQELVLQPGEIEGLVPGLDMVSYEEGWHGDRHTGRLWARKLG